MEKQRKSLDLQVFNLSLPVISKYFGENLTNRAPLGTI